MSLSRRSSPFTARRTHREVVIACLPLPLTRVFEAAGGPFKRLIGVSLSPWCLCIYTVEQATELVCLWLRGFPTSVLRSQTVATHVSVLLFGPSDSAALSESWFCPCGLACLKPPPKSFPVSSHLPPSSELDFGELRTRPDLCDFFQTSLLCKIKAHTDNPNKLPKLPLGSWVKLELKLRGHRGRQGTQRRRM